MATEAGSLGEALSKQILAGAGKIARRNLGPEDAVGELRVCVATLGLADAADRHVARLRRVRERLAPRPPSRSGRR